MSFQIKYPHATQLILILLLIAQPAFSQDTLIYRNRGESGQQTVKGKVEGESLAGVKIAGKTIPPGDVVDVQYEIPGSIKLDLPKAIQAEANGNFDEAVREYKSLLIVPAVTNNKLLKRYFDFKIAWLTAARAENGPDGLREAIDALTKFNIAHPDAWQRLIVTRLLWRLHLDSAPPNYDAARKVLDELLQAANVAPEIKAECTYAIVDLWLKQNKVEEARKALASAPATEPRKAIYDLLIVTDAANVDSSIKKLTEQRDRVDNSLKPVIYNALGRCFSLDPKHKKDALFAYLWVDVVYNFDPLETAKAQDRLADLFQEMKDDDRAKMYRNKARGR